MSDPTGLGIELPAIVLIAARTDTAAAPGLPEPPAARLIVPPATGSAPEAGSALQV